MCSKSFDSTAVVRYLILSGVLLLAFALRVWMLHGPELWGDEVFTFMFTRHTLVDMAANTVAMVEPHPLGSYVVFKMFSAAAGTRPFGMRYASVFFGTLAVALMWPISLRLRFQAIHKSVPYIAVGLMAVNAYAVHYSREARMYSMVMAAVGIGLYLGWRLLAGLRFRTALAYGVACAFLVHLHYFSALTLIAQNLCFLYVARKAAFHRRKRMVLLWVTSQIVALALILPWVVYARTAITGYKGVFAATVSFGDALADVFGSHFLLQESFIARLLSAVVVLVVMFCAVAILTKRHDDLGVSAVWLFVLATVPFVSLWLWSQGRGTFHGRYVIAILLPSLLITAASLGLGLSHLSIQRLRTNVRAARSKIGHVMLPVLCAVWVAGASGFSIWGTFREFSRYVYGSPRNWLDFLAIVDQFDGGLPREQISPALSFPNPIFSYYYDAIGEYVTMPYRAADADSAAEVAQKLTDRGVRRVILKEERSWWDPDQLAAKALSARYAEIYAEQFDNWVLRVYSLPDAEAVQPLGAAYGRALVLDAALATHEPAPGLLVVSVRWRAGESTRSGSEKMFVHVTPLDNAGAVVAQIDLPISDADLTRPLNTFGIRLPEDLPSGRYQVRIGVYDPSLPGAPRLLTAAGADATTLLMFDVR